MHIDPLDVEKVVPDAKLGIGRKLTPVKVLMLVAVLAVGGGALYLTLTKKSEPVSPFGETQLPQGYNPTAPVEDAQAPTSPTPEANQIQVAADAPSLLSAPQTVAPQPVLSQAQAPVIHPTASSIVTATAVTAPAQQSNVSAGPAVATAATPPVPQPVVQPFVAVATATPSPAAAPVPFVEPVLPKEEKPVKPKAQKPKRIAKPAPKSEVAVAPATTSLPEGELVTSEEILIIQ